MATQYQNLGMSSGWFPAEHTETWLEKEEVITQFDKAHFDKQEHCGKCGFTIICEKCEFKKDVEKESEAKELKKCPKCGGKTLFMSKDGVWDPICGKFYCFDCVKKKDVYMKSTDIHWTEKDEKVWNKFMRELPNQPKELQWFVAREIKKSNGTWEGSDMVCPNGHVLRKWRIVHVELI